jgi:hypothetical protein
MRYLLLVALASTAIGWAQETEVSKQSMHGTISNLDPDPAIYKPDTSLRYAATPTPTLRSERLASAPGATLGEITDFQETYGLPVFGQGNGYNPDVYANGYGDGIVPGPIARRGARQGVLAGGNKAPKPAQPAHAATRSSGRAAR